MVESALHVVIEHDNYPQVRIFRRAAYRKIPAFSPPARPYPKVRKPWDSQPEQRKLGRSSRR